MAALRKICFDVQRRTGRDTLCSLITELAMMIGIIFSYRAVAGSGFLSNPYKASQALITFKRWPVLYAIANRWFVAYRSKVLRR